MIKLVEDTIDREDIDLLIEWLKRDNLRLTQGTETKKFEEEWSNWLGTNYSSLVNSGSSANFLMLLALNLSNKIKNNNKKIIIPAVSWSTSVSPAMIMDFDPILCDCSLSDFNLDINKFEVICREEQPAAALVVHILGHSARMDEIKKICDKYNVVLLEDCCESHGATYNGKKVGTWGLMSSFSFYFGHHMSTIEGGMISTDDEEIDDILKSIRSHGWIRDFSDKKKENLKRKLNLGDFESLYSFIYPGMNMRSTDLNAFIGRNQLKKLDSIIEKRERNYKFFLKNLGSNVLVQQSLGDLISCFALGLISCDRDKLANKLIKNGIECRPLVCGSIGEQPFWKNYIKSKQFRKESFERDLSASKIIHKQGMYVPCHPNMTEDDILKICEVINEF